MRCRRLIAIAALVSATGASASVPESFETDALEAAALEAIEAFGAPAISIAAVTNDGSVRTFVLGTTAVNRGEAVTPETVFQLGSISKTLLAVLIVQLAEEGRFALDDPLRSHLPGFEHLSESVGIRSLLNHTAGMRDLFVLPGAVEAFSDLSKTREELAAAVRGAPVDFEPGDRWAYSNTHYSVLALLVEQVTGRPYEDVLAERVFRPFGLDSLRACTSLPARSGEAHGHRSLNGRVAASPPENMEWIRGDGGLCGNARDVARAFHLIGSGRMPSAAGSRQMAEPARLSDGSSFPYGFALSLIRPDGVAKIAHNGAMFGFSASAAWYPQSNVAVAVLLNLGGVAVEVVERRIARAVLGLPAPVPAARHAVADSEAAWIGAYDIGPLTARIEPRGSGLWLAMDPPGPTVQLGVLVDGRLGALDHPEATQVFRPEPGTAGPCDIIVQMAAMHWCGVRR